MNKILIIFILMTSLLSAQTWKNAINLGISAGSNDRVGLYTDNKGNHIILQTSTQLLYYRYSSGGILLGSSVIETYSESKRQSIITGINGNIYVIYKKGSEIKSKRSTNGGSSWASLTAIPMGYSISDGLDAVSTDDFTYLSWSEKQGTTDDYETYFMKIDHLASTWQGKQQVTDELNKKGGRPSITYSSNRVTVGFTNIVSGDLGDVYTRELLNNTWQASNKILLAPSMRGVFVNDNSKSHAFIYELGDSPTLTSQINLNHYISDLGTNNWSFESKLYSYRKIEDVPEDDIVRSVITPNNLMYIGYISDNINRWDGTTFSSGFNAGNGWGVDIRVSASGNDVYVAWIESGNVHLRQKDYGPLKLANFIGIWSNNHPKVTWEVSEATDFQFYKVEKSTDGVIFEPCTTIVNKDVNYYEDNTEFQYSFGNTKAYVWYRAQQFDLENTTSPKTAKKGFTVNGPQNSVKQLIVSTDIKLAEFVLTENYPNPFNPETKISFGLPEQSTVSLKVYNIQGQVVATLADGVKQDGYYTASFDGSDLASGVYVYRFAARGLESGKVHNQIKRMLLIK